MDIAVDTAFARGLHSRTNSSDENRTGPVTRAIAAMRIEPPRRGFLRGLLGLPLIGGGVALLGAPSAVAEPVTECLMREYADWLVYEHHAVMAELTGTTSGASNRWRALFGKAWAWHRARGPIERDNEGDPMGDGVSFPSSRAALVLSTVGCDWRQS